jgi:ATP-dependent DNA helicase DinG
MPSRLLAAFPPGVAVTSVTLDEAVARVAARIGGRLSLSPAIGHEARIAVEDGDAG